MPGDLGHLVRDLVLLPWERLIGALASSMIGTQTDEHLLMYVMMTHVDFVVSNFIGNPPKKN